MLERRSINLKMQVPLHGDNEFFVVFCSVKINMNLDFHITFVASKFVVVNFLCVFDAVLKKQ